MQVCFFFLADSMGNSWMCLVALDTHLLMEKQGRWRAKVATWYVAFVLSPKMFFCSKSGGNKLGFCRVNSLWMFLLQLWPDHWCKGIFCCYHFESRDHILCTYVIISTYRHTLFLSVSFSALMYLRFLKDLRTLQLYSKVWYVSSKREAIISTIQWLGWGAAITKNASRDSDYSKLSSSSSSSRKHFRTKLGFSWTCLLDRYESILPQAEHAVL